MSTDNNKLIAEFMGYSQPHPKYPTTTYWYKKDFPPLTVLLWDTSWDWLMEVIEKCRESQIFGRHRLIRNIDKGLMELDIIRTYRNVVDYITWYNNN